MPIGPHFIHDAHEVAQARQDLREDTGEILAHYSIQVSAKLLFRRQGLGSDGTDRWECGLNGRTNGHIIPLDSSHHFHGLTEAGTRSEPEPSSTLRGNCTFCDGQEARAKKDRTPLSKNSVRYGSELQKSYPSGVGQVLVIDSTCSPLLFWAFKDLVHPESTLCV